MRSIQASLRACKCAFAQSKRGLAACDGSASIFESARTLCFLAGSHSNQSHAQEAVASSSCVRCTPQDGHVDRCRLASHGFASTSGATSEDAEIAKFSAVAEEWWNPSGPFAALLSMTPVRTLFIRRAVCQCLRLQEHVPRPLQGLKVLDVGCGGGMLSEALARLGAQVTGIDLSERTIGAAQAHLSADPQLQEHVKYRACSADSLVNDGAKFDAVIASEVIEHVIDPGSFLRTLSQLTRHDGALVISTLARTARSYAFAIVGAEYVAGLVPRGTHDWNKFLTPEDLVLLTDGTQLSLRQIAGMSLDLLTQRWSLSQDLAVNYIACFQKQGLQGPAGQ